MEKHNTPIALARTLSKQIDPVVIKQSIAITLSLIAAVRCFLAARDHASLV
jgi:hypothetical protein